MAHAEGNITIHRSVQVVFDFILDGTNSPHWRPGVMDIAQVPGKPLGVGTVFKQGLKGPGGRRIEGDYEIVECRPNEFIKFQVIAGPARPIGTYTFEAIENATYVTFTLHYDPKGLSKLMNPIIAQTMRGEVATLSNLKTYLEGQQ